MYKKPIRGRMVRTSKPIIAKSSLPKDHQVDRTAVQRRIRILPWETCNAPWPIQVKVGQRLMWFKVPKIRDHMNALQESAESIVVRKHEGSNV